MLTNMLDIKHWLDEMKIENYVINDDLTVDVKGKVEIGNRSIIEIPIQFGIVQGYFSCYQNNLTSLRGSPIKVIEFFNCSENNLTSLKYCPEEVGHNFYFNGNKIQSLKDGPMLIGGIFSGAYNPIKNFNGLNTFIGRRFEHEVDSLDESIPGFRHLYQNILSELDTYSWILFLTPQELENIKLAEKLEIELTNNLNHSTKKTKL